MENSTPGLEPRRTTSDSALYPGSALVLAAWFGVVGGALDLGMIFLNRDFFHSSPYYEQGRNFRWVVPVANLLVMMAPGVAVALVSWFRPGLISRRTAVWLFATLAIWGPLLRAPLYGMATLLLAFGAGGVVSRRFAQCDSVFQRLARYSSARAPGRHRHDGGRHLHPAGSKGISIAGAVASTPGRRAQRPVDRHGHRPRQ